MTTAIHAAMSVGAMSPEDWTAVRSIYQEGIFTGDATFEMEVPAWEEWNQAHLPVPRLVVKIDDLVVGWAALRPYSARPCYRGVAEVSVYVTSRAQRQGIGRMLLREMIQASEEKGIWMLQGSVFPENHLSLRMCEACGFRQVGRRKHIAKLNGLWRDTILVERRSTRVGIG
jgi:L-amino acid N-acyltransferase YncA